MTHHNSGTPSELLHWNCCCRVRSLLKVIRAFVVVLTLAGDAGIFFFVVTNLLELKNIYLLSKSRLGHIFL